MKITWIFGFFAIIAVVAAVPLEGAKEEIAADNAGKAISLLDVDDVGVNHENTADRNVRHGWGGYGGYGGGWGGYGGYGGGYGGYGGGWGGYGGYGGWGGHHHHHHGGYGWGR
ncbi:uncharacterized protein LOC133323131 [Musca vetustissima]|uniref:uncharacterized protein LOC133323131 n=1 Tax=Musca vetustissima TaxID=27455 RepID=UPI002AB79409|nr:uncharacterized protein LOC133323131 [Musca vetustissima]